MHELTSRMSRETQLIIDNKLEEARVKRNHIMGGMGGADYTSGLHDDPSIVRDIQMLDSAIAQYIALLQSAEVVEKNGANETIQVGSVFTVLFIEEDESETFRLGTSVDAAYNTEGIPWVSLDSPLGSALVGRQKGEKIEFNNPARQVVKVKILAIG